MNKAEQRRQSILELLGTAPMVPVAELAEKHHVTMETIRKDLEIMEEEGTVTRIRGGAALTQYRVPPMPYSTREVIHKEEKQAIAKAACSLIDTGDMLLLESSTTTFALCQELLKDAERLSTLTIVTNAIYIAQLFQMGALCRGLFLLGGWIMPTEGATRGTFTTECVEHFHVDKAFLGGAALDEQMRLSSFYESDLYFQKKAMACAKSTIVLLDSSKYPRQADYNVCGLERIDVLVTDISFNRAERELLEQKRVRVVECGSET